MLSGLALLLGFAPPYSSAQELDWYAKASGSCAAATASATDVLRTIGLEGPVLVASTNGHVYVKLQVRDMFKGSSLAPAQILSTVVLDKARAQSLRDYFKRQAAGFEVPLVADLSLSGIAGLAGAGTAYAVFAHERDAIAVSLRTAAMLVAEGGRLEIVLVPKLSADAPHARILSRYVAPIGKEERSVVIQNCVIPVRVEVTEFRTLHPLNAKKIIRQSSGTFKQFDLEEPQVDSEYEVIGQDFHYIYLREPTDSTPSRLYRISFRGGPMQHQNSAGTFQTLYAEVSAD
ncbi:hypothetical protein [Pseudoxanthomonas spadix]|uniref:hypothetical protein n=1 Tax=Pseudoxanthomonas spadix TaxID=415229 RepID=UPI001EE64AE0|nr:hypothetical protein [Pseudoxanthomonas spadix]